MKKYNVAQIIVILAFLFFVFVVYRSVLRLGDMVSFMIWKPQIVCEESSYNLGSVSKTKPTHEFVILNKGNRGLLIQDVVAGCGSCVEVVDFPKVPIVPKSSGTIKLALLTDLLRGKVTKDVLVKSNDPKNPNFILTLEAEIIDQQNESETVSDSKNDSDKIEDKDDDLLKVQDNVNGM
jgi:hypothetical protein